MKMSCLITLALIVAGPGICRAADSFLTYEDLTTRLYPELVLTLSRGRNNFVMGCGAPPGMK